MGLFGTIVETLAASPSTTGRATTESTGAYWCHDCEERILDTDVEGEGPPDCPSCGDEMEFERSVGTASCAC